MKTKFVLTKHRDCKKKSEEKNEKSAIEMQPERSEMFTKNIRQCHVLTRVRTSGDKRRLKDFHTCRDRASSLHF